MVQTPFPLSTDPHASPTRSQDHRGTSEEPPSVGNSSASQRPVGPEERHRCGRSDPTAPDQTPRLVHTFSNSRPPRPQPDSGGEEATAESTPRKRGCVCVCARGGPIPLFDLLISSLSEPHPHRRGNSHIHVTAAADGVRRGGGGGASVSGAPSRAMGRDVCVEA